MLNGGLEIHEPLHSSTPKRYEEEAIDAELFAFFPEYDETMSGEQERPAEDVSRSEKEIPNEAALRTELRENHTYVSPGGREYATKVN